MEDQSYIRKIVLANATPEVKDWLLYLEERLGEEAVRDLLCALHDRMATLSELWLVFVYSFTDDVESNLKLLDYHKAKVGPDRPLEEGDFLDDEGRPLTLS